ncbi:SMI1/KNR4 family protein [Cytobacillus purgationiresistens]|uniref:Knr4/Smi1-like domain-containing protein n=1 Tax=Cytobacillus purgationiresistens TaxID=863449 RepID=A0ABU0ANK3_9BACI|nr:SMI1/KNR4 family protein [Cytobacillus purgationiresistens]MDQ0271640.1 hypothetical protein [Cytobacillus purgationiresistens]
MRKILEICNDIKPATDAEIIEAEKQLKVKLPDSYIRLVKEQNGGRSIHNAFPTKVATSWEEDHIQIDEFHGIGGEGMSILDSGYLIQEWELPEDIVLISGDGHSWVALDYRKRKENPSVIYLDSEMEQTIELADSFDEFLQGLYTAEYKEEEESFEIWTDEEVVAGFISDDDHSFILTLNYIYEHPNPLNYKMLVEEHLYHSLHHQDDERQEISALYITHFHQKNILSPEFLVKAKKVFEEKESLKVYLELLK